MHLKIQHYQTRHSMRSFITRSERDGSVQVREWEYVAPSTAEEVLEVQLSLAAYKRATRSQGGDEREAQRVIVAEARRRRELSIFRSARLPYVSMRLLMLRAHPANGSEMFGREVMESHEPHWHGQKGH
jgi:hypothetical protein